MLKKRFTTEPILVALDLDKKMRMEVDVSDYVTGEVLLMECANGRWRLVVYLSKSLNETEWNYEIYDKEILAMIRELKVWRHLLESTKFKFVVQTDHKNLVYFMKVQKLIKEEWIRGIIEVVVEGPETVLVEKIRRA